MTPFAEKLASRTRELRSLEVPEWGDTIYWTPVTVTESDRFSRTQKKQGDAEAMLDVIIAKTLDAKGERLFDDGAEVRAMLAGEPATLIARICEAIGAEETKDQAKNA